MSEQTDSYFEKLDFKELKRSAKLWVMDKDKGGSCIQSISLCRPVGEGKNNGFVFVVEVSTNDDSAFSYYQNWAWGSCLHIQNLLPSFYTNLKSPVIDKWIWITFRDDVDTAVNIALFENHCDPDCKVVLYPNQVCDFCKEALKKEYIDIIKLSHILAREDKYQKKSLSCLWKTLEMSIRDKKEPDLFSIETKVGTWFKILLRVTTGKIAGRIHPLKIKRLVNYAYDQDSGELQNLSDSESGNFIKLSDLKSYFKDQLEMEPPSKLFPPKERLLPKGGTNLGYNQQGETEDDKLDHFISWVKYEVELFYSRLKDAQKTNGKTIGEATLSRALDVFNKNMNSFDKIKEEDIQGNFYGGDHPTRAKGSIANKTLRRVDPELFLNLKGKANAQELDKLLRKQPMK